MPVASETWVMPASGGTLPESAHISPITSPSPMTPSRRPQNAVPRYVAGDLQVRERRQGHSATHLCRVIGCNYKVAFVLLHKVWECMESETAGAQVGGKNDEVEMYGTYLSTPE